MRQKFFVLILICAALWVAALWRSHSAAASVINTVYKGNVTSGLVGWWTFDGVNVTTNTTTDKSGNGNNGTRNGGKVVVGKIGQAMKFNSTSDYINCGTASSLSVNTGSFSVWFKAAATQNNNARIMEIGNAADRVGFYIESGSKSLSLYPVKASAPLWAPTTVSPVNDNRWHHAAGTWSASGGTFYLDGKFVSSSVNNLTLSLPANPTCYIGEYVGGGSFYFNGTIDDPRIYNRALSAAEIKKLYQMGAGTTVSKTPVKGPLVSSNLTSGLVLWYPFEKNYLSASTASDSSGQSNNGMRLNTTTPAVGRLGQGLGLDGNSGFVSTTDNSSLRVTNFTLSAWTKQKETSRVDSIISKGPYSLKIGADGWPYAEIITSSTAITDAGHLYNYPYALAVYNGKLYGGDDTGHVYRYNGDTTWTDLGQIEVTPALVKTLVVFGGKFYAGAGDGHVYRYDDGAPWTDVGSVGGSTEVKRLAVVGGKLYSGADDGTVYRYDGDTTWTNVGNPGTISFVNTLSVLSGHLYLGGDNDDKVYRYDGGSTWTSVGSPSSYGVHSLTVYNGKLYAGSEIVNHVYRYDGDTTWADVGALGSSSIIDVLAVFGSKLFAGADNGHVYRYDGGTTWADLGQLGPATYVYSMAVYDGKLYAGIYPGGRIYSIGDGAAIYANSTLNGFNHLAATYDGSTMKLYINGTLKVSSSTSKIVSTTTNNLLVGSSYGSSGASIGEENFNGSLDEVRVYNRALADKDIFNLYQSGNSKIAVTPGKSGPSKTSGINSGMLGWWTFDNKDITTNTSTDKSGNGNDCTRNGTGVRVGKIGQALNFNGASDYLLSKNNVSLTVGDQKSISAWIYWKGGNGSIVLFGAVNSFNLYMSNSPALCADWVGDSKCTSAATAPAQNKWYHVAVTADTLGDASYQNIKLYVNGVMVTSTHSYSFTGAGQAYIGGGSSYYFNGAIDDVRIYNRVLSATEVQQLYRMGK